MNKLLHNSNRPEDVGFLKEENKYLKDEVRDLKEQLQWFKRNSFGSKNEKLHENEIDGPDLFGELNKT